MIGKVAGVATCAGIVSVVAPVIFMVRYFKNPDEIAGKIADETIAHFTALAEELWGILPDPE